MERKKIADKVGTARTERKGVLYRTRGEEIGALKGWAKEEAQNLAGK